MAHLAFGIEDGDAAARGVGESREGCLACVARGGGDDHDALAFGARGAGHEAGEHLQGDILERARRATEELHDIGGGAVCIGCLGEGDERRHLARSEGAGVGLIHACGNLVCGIIRQERPHDLTGERGVILIRQRGDIDGGATQVVGHKQAAVRGDTAADSLLARKGWRSGTCAMVKTHVVDSLKARGITCALMVSEALKGMAPHSSENRRSTQAVFLLETIGIPATTFQSV